MDNRKYNLERKAQSMWAKKDFETEALLEAVHIEAKKQIQAKIDNYYIKYADINGLSRAEAMKRIKYFDVPSWAEKAAKAVKEKDFSPETNKWLKTYNNKMYISRLELLKAEIDIELQAMYSKEHKLIDTHLERAYLDELERQAGILKISSTGSVERARELINADFYGTNFSQKVWGRTGLYYEHQRAIFSSLNRIMTNMDGYKKERTKLMHQFDIKEHEALRLLKTESARMRSSAQFDTYDKNGFTHFGWISESGACKDCSAFTNKVFPIEKFEIGVTAPPIHPNDRCSTYGIIEMKRKDGTSNLDGYDKG